VRFDLDFGLGLGLGFGFGGFTGGGAGPRCTDNVSSSGFRGFNSGGGGGHPFGIGFTSQNVILNRDM
jgi:hypothetical protein